MRRQLVAVFAAVASLVAVAFVVPLGLLVQRTAEDRAIDAARSDASAVIPIVALGADPTDVERALALTGSGARGEMTVVTPTYTVGRVAGDSERLDGALSTGRTQIGPVDGGEEVVVAIATNPGELSAIRVFVPDDRLRAGRARAWVALGLVAGVLMLIAVVVARVEPDGPDELVRLGEVFNQLGSRIEGMLVSERELVAELSHRLRTPLTALRLRLDHLDDADLAEQLDRDLDEVVAVVDDLIGQARRTPSASTGAPGDQSSRCDGSSVAIERAEYWSALAEDQGRPWDMQTGAATAGAGPAWVALASPDLAAAVDAALENVFAHTPDGTPVLIVIARTDGRLDITVADAGPGIPPEAAQRGVAGAGSTGLGLDIIRRTCESAGGSLALSPSPLGGAAVTMQLPLVGSPDAPEAPNAPDGPGDANGTIPATA